MIDWPAVVAEHGPRVWRTVYRVLGHHADALDCYQDVFLDAHRAAGRSPVSDWAAFLAALASRRAIDRLRGRTRLRGRVTNLDHDPAGAADPAEAAAVAELTARVRDRLAELPERQAEVFWLSCVEGLPHDRIAAHLKTSPGAVRVLLHRARAALGRSLNEDTATRSRR
ncbi:MAG: sigma-70 family RNA polymerase sigma factor [Gemmataceae bacterium]|nr:sigma-70 family RNA polymerase sigma factor [Gemmataceae bacterium]